MIVDTDVLSDFLNGKDREIKLLEHYSKDNEIATTDINVFELYYGAHKSGKTERNTTKLKGFLNRTPVYSTSEDSMELAGKLAANQEEEGKRVGVKDVLIGAIASLENQKVLTRNRREFERLEGVETAELEIPEEDS